MRRAQVVEDLAAGGGVEEGEVGGREGLVVEEVSQKEKVSKEGVAAGHRSEEI